MIQWPSISIISRKHSFESVVPRANIEWRLLDVWTQSLHSPLHMIKFTSGSWAVSLRRIARSGPVINNSLLSKIIFFCCEWTGVTAHAIGGILFMCVLCEGKRARKGCSGNSYFNFSIESGASAVSSNPFKFHVYRHRPKENDLFYINVFWCDG